MSAKFGGIQNSIESNRKFRWNWIWIWKPQNPTAQISRSLTPLVQISHFSRRRKTFAHDMLASVELQHKTLYFSHSSRLIGTAAHLTDRAGRSRQIGTVVRSQAVAWRSLQVAVLQEEIGIRASRRRLHVKVLDVMLSLWAGVINLPADWSFRVLDRQSVENMANGVARKDCGGSS